MPITDYNKDGLREELGDNRNVSPEMDPQSKPPGSDSTLQDLNQPTDFGGVGSNISAEDVAYKGSLVDHNTRVFRYGLFDKSNEYEDPLFVGFTCEIDVASSPLFNSDIEHFIEFYSRKVPELKSRKELLYKFREEIQQFLRSQESGSGYYRSHYINSIGGLDKLTKPFVDRDDKITFLMNEDAAMRATYLSTLYNNLTWSYTMGRNLIPENLLWFTLKLKFAEIRNVTSINRLVAGGAEDLRIIKALRSSITSQIFTLHNCEFDFKESKNFGENVSVGGYSANKFDPANMTFSVKWRSTSRIFRPSLLGVAMINDIREDLGRTQTQTQEEEENFSMNPRSQPSSGMVNPNVERPQDFSGGLNQNPPEENNNDYEIGFLNEGIKEPTRVRKFEPNTGSQDSSSSSSDPEFLSNLQGLDEEKRRNNTFTTDNFRDIVKRNAQVAADKIRGEWSRKRSEIIGNFLYEVRGNLGIKKIVPANIYELNQSNLLTALQSIRGETGFQLNDLFKSIIPKF